MKKNLLFIGVMLVASSFLVAFTVNSKKNNQGDDKVTICHIPPGNPENAHAITVDASAVQAHLDHGDQLGSCGG